MGNNLRKLREERGLTLRDMADKTGYSFSQIQKLEMGDRRLSFVWKQRLATVLECHPDDLDSEDAGIHVPIVGVLGAGAKVKLAQPSGKGGGLSEPAAPSGFNPKKTVAIEVKGDALAPLICNGFRLYYEDKIYGVPEEFLGKICVVEVESGQVYVKILRKGSKLGYYHLENVNPNDPPLLDVRIKWSAKVRFWEQP